MSTPQVLLGLGALGGAVNAAHQGISATAPISDLLAVFSGIEALLALLALGMLRRRHSHAVPMLVAWGASLIIGVVWGTELVLADALSLVERLPGYLAATAFAVFTVVAGTRELARSDPAPASPRVGPTPGEG